MTNLHSYNPNEVKCSLGTFPIHGFSDDSFIEISYSGDGTTTKRGADGEITRSIDPSTEYKVTITLMQSSSCNFDLQNLFDYDQKSGKGIGPFIMKDLWGRELFTAPFAWVVKPASNKKGKASDTREWEIDCTGGQFINA